MQTKLSLYLNEIFKYLVLFLLFFVWINFYYPNFLVSVLLAIALAGISSYLLSLLFYNKLNKLNLTTQDKKQIKQCNTEFLFNDLHQNISLYSQVFTAKNTPHKTTEYGIILYPESEHKILFLPYYTPDQITETTIITAYKQLNLINAYRCLICGISFSQEAKQLAESFKNATIVLYGDQEVYQHLLKPANTFPPPTNRFKETKHLNLKTFLHLLINSNNTKQYFYAGLITLFASFFIRLNTYYVVFSSILLLLSLASFYSNFIFNQHKPKIRIYKN